MVPVRTFTIGADGAHSNRKFLLVYLKSQDLTACGRRSDGLLTARGPLPAQPISASMRWLQRFSLSLCQIIKPPKDR